MMTISVNFDLTGFQRAGAIIAGLVLTTTDYLVGTIPRFSDEGSVLLQG